MTASRAELREQLLATLHAAEELPRDERSHLADSFLDHLEADFRLVPRSAIDSGSGIPNARRGRSLRGSAERPSGRPPLLYAWFPFVLVLLVTATFVFHAPFLPLLGILLIARFALRGPWWHRSRVW
jgi:hypothetical protein